MKYSCASNNTVVQIFLSEKRNLLRFVITGYRISPLSLKAPSSKKNLILSPLVIK